MYASTKKHNRIHRTLRLLLACLLLCLPAQAAQWGTGIGIGWERSPYIGVDGNTRALPLISYRGPSLEIRGLDASYRLAHRGLFEARALLHTRLPAYDPDDSRELRGMQGPETTLEGGLEVRGYSPHGTFAIGVRSDLLGKHDGQQAQLGWSLPQPIGERWTLTPRVQINWQNAQLADSLYAVSPAEARSWRPVFRPGSSWNVEAALGARTQLLDRLILQTSFGMRWLDDSATQSPLIEHRTQPRLALLIAWQW